MNTVKISVITVAFQAAGTIRDTLESVAGQDYKMVEHIVIDGGSTDQTMEIVKSSLQEGGIAISEPDDGLYHAMNKGVSMATGDVVGFLNSDDIYQDNTVLSAIAAAFSDPSVDAVYGDLVYFSDDAPTQDRRYYSSRSFSKTSLRGGWMPAHPTLYVRRSTFAKAGLFRTDYSIAADFEFCVRLFSRPDLRSTYLPRIMVRMRMGGLSTQGWRSKVVIAAEIRRALRENGLRPSWIGILGRYLHKGAGSAVDSLLRKN
jgi:glycosyltransferase involved in cell wall biosynthesis